MLHVYIEKKDIKKNSIEIFNTDFGENSKESK